MCAAGPCAEDPQRVTLPLYQSTVTVSQSVSERSAQACQRRWRLPFVGVGPRMPAAEAPAGDRAPHPSAGTRP